MRHEIESTRATLTRDIDRLAAKTSPRQVARRRWTAVKEKVMGSTVQDKASHAADVASDKAQDAADAVRSAPQAVIGQTRGNPLAAGVIAFGVGLLAATLIPVTDAERRAGQELKEHSDQLTDRVKDVAGEMKDDLGDTVQQAAGRVKETARDAAHSTGEQVRASAQDAKDRTVQSVRTHDS
jgi:hypothetical protein